MPAGFEKCVRDGGRVRTIKPKPGRYLHVCYIGGKSYSGEVKHTKEELDAYLLNIKDGEHRMKKIKTEEFTESLNFSIIEDSIDEEKHTVRVCALASCVSKNNNYYSPEVVEGAFGSLEGKKSYADHDDRNTKNLIGKIIDENYKEGKLFADIKISKARGTARETWDKINDGIITDVSIAANGKTRMIKLGNKKVKEVRDLDIRSVDFVPEGGVIDAKVQRVFENLKDIPKVTEVKEEMIENLDQLKKEYPDFVDELKEENKVEIEKLKTDLKKANEAKEAAEFKLVKKELDEFKEESIAKLDVNDKVKDILRSKVDGKTKEEITKSLEKVTADAKAFEDAYKKKAKIDGVPESDTDNDDPKPTAWTQARIKADTRIPEELKIKACEILVLEGSEKMKEWLLTREIKL